jgi:hypothetical protein
MNTGSYLMAAKVLILIAAGAAFVWWQLRDLAQEKKRTAEREANQNNPLV